MKFCKEKSKFDEILYCWGDCVLLEMNEAFSNKFFSSSKLSFLFSRDNSLLNESIFLGNSINTCQVYKNAYSLWDRLDCKKFISNYVRCVVDGWFQIKKRHLKIIYFDVLACFQILKVSFNPRLLFMILCILWLINVCSCTLNSDYS